MVCLPEATAGWRQWESSLFLGAFINKRQPAKFGVYFLLIIIHICLFLSFTFCRTLFLQKYSYIGCSSYIGSASPFSNIVLVQRSGYFTLSSWPLRYVYDGSFSGLWLRQEIRICLACIWQRRIWIYGNIYSFTSFMKCSCYFCFYLSCLFTIFSLNTVFLADRHELGVHCAFDFVVSGASCIFQCTYPLLN